MVFVVLQSSAKHHDHILSMISVNLQRESYSTLQLNCANLLAQIEFKNGVGQ